MRYSSWHEILIYIEALSDACRAHTSTDDEDDVPVNRSSMNIVHHIFAKHIEDCWGFPFSSQLQFRANGPASNVYCRLSGMTNVAG